MRRRRRRGNDPKCHHRNIATEMSPPKCPHPNVATDDDTTRRRRRDDDATTRATQRQHDDDTTTESTPFPKNHPSDPHSDPHFLRRTHATTTTRRRRRRGGDDDEAATTLKRRRCGPPGASLQVPGALTQSLQVPGQSPQVPLTVVAASRCPHNRCSAPHPKCLRSSCSPSQSLQPPRPSQSLLTGLSLLTQEDG